MAPPADRSIGQHTLSIEEDIVFVRLSGFITLDQARELHVHIAQVLATVGRVFVITDQTNGARASKPEVRRFMAEWNKQHKVSGAVLYGGGLMHRAAATLALSAIRLFRSGIMPIAFVKSEVEARAWVTDQRQKP